MPVRHIVLVVLAGAILVAALYLFHAVREVPAVAAALPARHTPTPVRDEPAPPPPSRPAPPLSHAAAPPELAGDADPAPEDVDLTASGSAFDAKIDEIMSRANKAYDSRDYETAKSIAQRVLAQYPTNVRMIRIMVSSACFEGDAGLAQQWYAKLTSPLDRAQMKQRCDKDAHTPLAE